MSASTHVDQGILAQDSQVHIAGGIHYHATTAHSSADLRQRLMSSLKFKGMDERYYNVNEELYDTCEWLSNTPAWLTWQESFNTVHLPRLFWIKGHPGAGKSTLMHFAHSRHTPEANEIVLSHYFNARGGELERSIVGMQRTLLSQLLSKLPSHADPDAQLRQYTNIMHRDILIQIQKKVPKSAKLDPQLLEVPSGEGTQRDLHSQLQNKLTDYANLDPRFLENILPHDGEWTRGRLHELFTEILRKNQHCSFTLFIDALDECDEEQARQVVNDFSSLLLNRSGQYAKTRICLASRYYPGVTIPPNVGHYVLQLEVELGHLHDIAHFISEKLFVGEQIFEEVYHGLINKANRSFLWCELVVTELNQKFSDGLLSVDEAKAILQQVPPDLSGLFQRLLGMGPDNTPLDKNTRDELRICMQWVLFAQSKLTPYELCRAVFKTTQVDEMTGQSWARMPPKEGSQRLVVKISRGLVGFSHEGDHVQVIHESVRDFFLREGGLEQMLQTPDGGSSEAMSHDLLKKVCWEELVPTNQPFEEHLYYPGSCDDVLLEEYAKGSILIHADRAQELGIDQTDFLRAMPTKPGALTESHEEFDDFLSLRGIWLSIARRLIRDNVSHLTRAFVGIVRNLPGDLCPMLLGVVSRSSEPLSDSLLVLVDELRLSQPTGSKRNLLDRLALRSHEIQSIPQEEAIRPYRSASNAYASCCLLNIAHQNYATATSVLVLLAPDHCITGLTQVLSDDFLQTLLYFLSEGVPTRTFFRSDAELLSWAVQHGFTDLYEPLLRNADFSDRNEEANQEVVHSVVRARQYDLLERLIERDDVDINRIGGNFMTPLHEAVRAEDDIMVDLLVGKARKIELTATDIWYCNVKSWSVKGSYSLIMGLLLQAEYRQRGGQGDPSWSELHYAVERRDLETAQRLLEDGSFSDVQDSEGATPLDRALQQQSRARDGIDYERDVIDSEIDDVMVRLLTAARDYDSVSDMVAGVESQSDAEGKTCSGEDGESRSSSSTQSFETCRSESSGRSFASAKSVL